MSVPAAVCPPLSSLVPPTAWVRLRVSRLYRPTFRSSPSSRLHRPICTVGNASYAGGAVPSSATSWSVFGAANVRRAAAPTQRRRSLRPVGELIGRPGARALLILDRVDRGYARALRNRLVMDQLVRLRVVLLRRRIYLSIEPTLHTPCPSVSVVVGHAHMHSPR